MLLFLRLLVGKKYNNIFIPMSIGALCVCVFVYFSQSSSVGKKCCAQAAQWKKCCSRDCGGVQQPRLRCVSVSTIAFVATAAVFLTSCPTILIETTNDHKTEKKRLCLCLCSLVR